MHTNVSLIDHWPDSVTLEIEVHYDRSAPDQRTYLLAASRCASEVRVLIPHRTGKPLELQRVSCSQLPGCTLYLRCLNALAVHWFGAVAMPPRVSGAPLWQRISVAMSSDDRVLQGLSFELTVADGMRAVLCCRGRDDQPLVRHTLVLDPLDTDPLRALLRVGALHVRPVLERSPVPESVRPRGKNLHAAPGMAQHA